MLAPLPSRWLRRTTSSTAWPVAAWALQDSAVERSEPAKPRDRMTWAILTTFYPAFIPSPAQRQPRDLVAKSCVQGPRLAQRQVAQPQRRRRAGGVPPPRRSDTPTAELQP